MGQLARYGAAAVGSRDRFARFGAEYVEAALSARGRGLLVADPAGAGGDLAGDVTEILALLCAGWYGQAAARDRAGRAAAALGRDGPA
jgi:predicted site-specific integrase-resolvase